MSKGIFYERNHLSVDQTNEEIFGSSESAVGDKLDGERSGGFARSGTHRLRVGGVLCCVDGDEARIDRDTQSTGRQTLALRLLMVFVVLNVAVHLSTEIFFTSALSFMIFYGAALLGLIMTSYRQKLFDDDD